MNDVMRELECAIEAGCGVYREVEVTVLKYARSILREQYAEIERLQETLLKAQMDAEQERFQCKNICEPTYKNLLETARSEAITEFAERVLALRVRKNQFLFVISKGNIDRIAKEMKGEGENDERKQAQGKE